MRSKLIALLAATMLLAGCSSEAETPELNGVVLDRPYAAPATPLTDTDGAPYSLTEETDRRLTLVFFGFIHCPDICHTVMSALTSGLTRLDDEERDQVDVVFVTTDPARDTEQVLRRYLDRYDDSYVGLTGKLDTIIDIAKPLAVAVEKGEKLPSGGYDVAHSTHVLGIASDDKAPILWTQDTSAAQFAEDFGVLLSGSGPALTLKP